MNGCDLSINLEKIRKISNKKKLDLLFLFDSEMLIVNENENIHKFSLSNMKKLLSVVKKERWKINKIVIKY